MKILVTGGTGYIGSHTVIELLNRDYEVVILDNLSNSNRDMVDRIQEISGKKVKFFQMDLLDKTGLSAIIEQEEDIEGVIHFAAFKAVGESVNQPLKYYQNNLMGLTNLLEVMGENEIHKIVFSSSCTVYGSPDQNPVTEKSPIKFTPSPYGATKQICERILEDYTHANKNVSAISLRYFNPIGAHSSTLIGELPSGTPNNLMPYITQTAVGVRDCLSVFGDDYDTPDGTGVRDYIHVSDLADAHVKAIDFLNSGSSAGHEKINIGTGNGYSVLEVIQSFEKMANLKVNYKISPRREGDVPSVFADPTKAKQLLGWTPKYTLDDMTKSSWEWELKLRKES